MTIHEDDPRLTAYALGEIEGEECDEFARALEADPQAKAEVRARRALAERLRAKPADPQAEGLDPLRRERVLAAAGRRPRRTRWLLVAAPALAAAALLLALFVLPRTSPPANVEDAGGTAIASSLEDPPSARARPGTPGFLERQASKPPAPPGATVVVDEERGLHLRVPGLPAAPGMDGSAVGDRVQSDLDAGGAESGPQVRLADAPLSGPASNGLIGLGSGAGARFGGRRGVRAKFRIRFGDAEPETTPPTPPHGTEAYGEIRDNRFYRVEEKDTSTFSIDVDTASYANVRRFLDREGRLPPPDAVRIEELVNYFPYDYAPPPADSEHPFAAHTAVAVCPWDPSHRLVRIALEGKVMAQEERPAANLVFLLDVSGSMTPANKLPLVKRSMRLLLDRLEARDTVSIVVYAGAAGEILPPTPGDRKTEIRGALERLRSGGSTNGGAGIELAYRIAQENFIEGGVNRVILCTDGDFNVGVSNTEALAKLVEKRAGKGVFLTILGFGMGNLKDDRMEELSNRGNGNYGYVDSLREAQKLLVDQGLSTLVTIAKDVKIQVFFNPKRVAGWRLIGYENRLLRKQDFNDDTKDAGEIGAGHAVTALYEIVPAGGEVRGAYADPNPFVEPPAKAEKPTLRPTGSNALLRLRLRYKAPDGDRSTLMEQDVFDGEGEMAEADTDFQWAAAVAGFGMLLRDSPYKGSCSWALVEEIAQAARGEDPGGYRAECLQLMRLAASLAR